MGLPFSKPPLIQAVCELRFSPDSAWDIMVPGLFYDLSNWKNEFPHREQQSHNQFQMDAQAHGMAFGVAPEVRVMLSNLEKTQSLTLGPNLLIVSATPPYKNWETLRALILKAVQDYQQIAAPLGLARVGLRYVNAVPYTDPKRQVEAHVTTWPRVPLEETKNHQWQQWAQRVEVFREDLRGLLVVQAGNNIPDPRLPPAILLDFDAISLQVSLEDLEDWLNLAHDAIEETFLASLTPVTRETFG
jgi:uncharacterized protein (TIGR04255 family)